MNKKDILNKAFDEISDEYLLEAAEERIKSRKGRKKANDFSAMLYRYGLAAACMIFIFIAATVQIWKYSGNQEGDAATTKEETTGNENQDVVENSTTAVTENAELESKPGLVVDYSDSSETVKAETVKVPGCIVNVLENEYEIRLCEQRIVEDEYRYYMTTYKMQTDYEVGQLVLVEVVPYNDGSYNPWVDKIFDTQQRTYMDVTRTWCMPKEVVGIEPFESDGVFYGTLVNGKYTITENSKGKQVMYYCVNAWETEVENFGFQFEIDATLFGDYLEEGDDVIVTYDIETFQVLSVEKADEETVRLLKPAEKEEINSKTDEPDELEPVKETGWIVSVTEDEYEIALVFAPSGHYMVTPKLGTDYVEGQVVRVELLPFSQREKYMTAMSSYNGVVSGRIIVKQVLGIEAIE